MLIYNRDVGGSRPRTAIGLKDGELCLYCTDSGRTPMELQAELLALGWESAVMLDGGGSSQCDLVGKRIVSNRKVHNLILVYTRKRAPSEPSDNDKEDKPVDDITQAVMTNSDCYKAGRTITPKGIMVHSTATPGADAQTIRSAWTGQAQRRRSTTSSTTSARSRPCWTPAGVGTAAGRPTTPT